MLGHMPMLLGYTSCHDFAALSMHALMHANAYRFAVVLLLFRNPEPLTTRQLQSLESDCDLHQAQIEAQGLFDDFEVLDQSMLLCMRRLTDSSVVVPDPGTQGPAPDKEAIAESESESDFDLHQAQTEAQRLFDDFEVLDPSMLLCMQRLTSSQWFCCCSGT